jgi:glycosyltransferase involved in cell wall biosynthesis
MRILAIECELTTLLGGSERSYFDVLTGLQNKGHQVTILYNRPGNLLEGYHKAGVRTIQSDHKLLLRPGTKIKDLASMVTTSRKVRSLGPFDVVYANFAEALPLSFVIKQFNRIPVVCHIRLPYFGLSRQILMAGRSVSAFIVINGKLKPVFENVFKATGKVFVIYNGLTIPETLPPVKSTYDKNSLSLLYLGRIAPDKGIIELVGAFAKAIKSGVRATLQITGDYIASHSGDYRSELQQAIDASGVSELIKISSPVNNPVEYISRFDLFVFPSVWDEPFGRTIGESILAGTPILARDVGMVKEIMADNPDFIFDTDDALARKIGQFSHGDLMFNTAAARNRIIVDFNKTRMVDEVEEKLMEVVSK